MGLVVGQPQTGNCTYVRFERISAVLGGVVDRELKEWCRILICMFVRSRARERCERMEDQQDSGHSHAVNARRRGLIASTGAGELREKGWGWKVLFRERRLGLYGVYKMIAKRRSGGG